MTEALKTRIRHVPDFPKAGILFYDVTTLLRDPQGFRLAIDGIAAPFTDGGIDLVVGIESRGFILGSAVADRIGAGFVPVQAGQAARGHGPRQLCTRLWHRQPRDAPRRGHAGTTGAGG